MTECVCAAEGLKRSIFGTPRSGACGILAKILQD